MSLEAGTRLGPYEKQLEAKTIDTRADVWAFGALFYEMLTGRKAFEGASQPSLIAAIMEHEPPPISERQSLSPQALDRTVTRCLTKSPENRWQSARDLREELRWIARGDVDSRIRVPAGSRLRTIAIAGLAALAGAVLGWSFLSSNVPTRAPVLRTVVPLPKGQRLAFMSARAPSAIALSPDGATLAYLAETDGVRQLYVRPLAQFESRVIPGTNGARGPFFSPDSRWLGFEADGKLQKVELASGRTTSIATVSNLTAGASWSSDDTIVFADLRSDGLMRVSADGGVPETLTRPDSPDRTQTHRLPRHLPGRQEVLFTIGDDLGLNIAILSLESLEWRLLDLAGSDARYVESKDGGLLLFQLSGELLSVPFARDSGVTTGTPSPVLHDVVVSAATRGAFVAASDTGLLAFVAGTGGAELIRAEAARSSHPKATSCPCGPPKAPGSWSRVTPTRSSGGRPMEAKNYKPSFSESNGLFPSPSIPMGRTSLSMKSTLKRVVTSMCSTSAPGNPLRSSRQQRTN